MFHIKVLLRSRVLRYTTRNQCCLVYTGGGDGTVRAFDVKSGVQKRLFGGHAGAVNAIAVSHSICFHNEFFCPLVKSFR